MIFRHFHNVKPIFHWKYLNYDACRCAPPYETYWDQWDESKIFFLTDSIAFDWIGSFLRHIVAICAKRWMLKIAVKEKWIKIVYLLAFKFKTIPF